MPKRHRPARGRLAALTLVLTALPAWATEVTLDAPEAADWLKDDLRSASLAVKAVEQDEVTDPQELLAAAQADYQRLVASLYSHAYYGPKVSIRVNGREAADMSVLNEPDAVDTIEISVDPGPRFRFGEAVVAPLPEGVTPPEDFAPGKLAQTPIMRTAARDAVTAWRDRGYPKAETSGQSITADHRTEEVDARFNISPGPKLTFGEVHLSPNSAKSRVRSERILAIAGVPEGETFSPEAVQTAERRLQRAGSFRSVVVQEDEGVGPNQTQEVTIDVEDARRRRIGAGIELDTDDGLTITTYWIHRNLFGGAERLRIDGEVAGIGGLNGGGMDYKLSALLTRPAFLHPDNTLYYGVNIEHEDEPSYTSDLIEGAVGVERYINERLTGTLGFGVRYSQTDDAFGSREFYHVIGTAGLTWNNRDNELNPTKGAYAEAELTPFVGVNGSKSGIRFEGDLRGYRALGEKFVLAGRLQLGSVLGPDIEDVPSDYLFYSGGGDTVRGQGYQSLGVEVNGDTVGGRSFFGVSTEVRADVGKSIGVVGFVDAGYIAGSSTFENGEWHAGAGVGARYFTPIGPVRLDVAVPLGEKIDNVQLYVGIGQAF
ncbi:autotransporter assembly complex protein TamA [Maritimibacter alkaliphilus]|uniref:autotransporter assembly complex protein TamA n=1 Tax=Maritimibacter alkaliphilus TaxID=404236 RepID=UPI001C94730C|nr:autotransporter assembly complex family protein [Maritimibacter alkaliphilus]MBY6091160.1 autotransporter assembly complex protein TamA [Maritimibacter alkaliphilus]